MRGPVIDPVDLVLIILANGSRQDVFHGVTRLEKLTFLASQELGERTDITAPQFVPFKFGPFSAEVYDALETLQSMRLVETGDPDVTEAREIQGFAADAGDPDLTRPDEPRAFHVTERGRNVATKLLAQLDAAAQTRLIALIARYASMPLDQLLKHVYQYYPDFTTMSVIRDRVMGRPPRQA